MNDLLNFIAKSLVTKPDAVLVTEQKDDGNVNLTLKVDTEDMGLIIGKGGQTIRAIRKLLTVRAIAENVRVNLQLAEPEGSTHSAHENKTENPVEEESDNPQPESSEEAAS